MHILASHRIPEGWLFDARSRELLGALSSKDSRVRILGVGKTECQKLLPCWTESVWEMERPQDIAHEILGLLDYRLELKVCRFALCSYLNS